MTYENFKIILNAVSDLQDTSVQKEITNAHFHWILFLVHEVLIKQTPQWQGAVGLMDRHVLNASH